MAEPRLDHQFDQFYDITKAPEDLPPMPPS